MTSRRIFALFLGLLLLVCPLLTACGDSENSVDNTSSDANASNSTTNNNTNTSSKYLDANGMYTLDNMNMPAFNFTQDTFTVCVYSNVVQDTYIPKKSSLLILPTMP